MERYRKAAEFKSMTFVQLVVDQPEYALILEIKNKNHVLFEKILPVLGGFHSSCSFLRIIYWRFKWSGLEDLAVAAGMIEPGSVDGTITGGHYERGIQIHKLIYESLVCILRKNSELSRSIKARLQNSFKFEKNLSEDKEIAKKSQRAYIFIFQQYWFWVTSGIILVVIYRDDGNPLLALSFNARSKLGILPTFNETNTMDVSHDMVLTCHCTGHQWRVYQQIKQITLWKQKCSQHQLLEKRFLAYPMTNALKKQQTKDPRWKENGLESRKMKKYFGPP